MDLKLIMKAKIEAAMKMKKFLNWRVVDLFTKNYSFQFIQCSVTCIQYSVRGKTSYFFIFLLLFFLIFFRTCLIILYIIVKNKNKKMIGVCVLFFYLT